MYQWDINQIPILQLGHEFYDPVTPATYPEKKLRYWNQSIDVNINKDCLWNFKALPQNIPEPLALRYHGHQFQHYNPDLGDGRGFLYAQIFNQNQWYDLGTKGSGQTPYSRRGDGRLTLKGAVREALATEMLQGLRVKTSKTFCIYETGEKLERNDEPSPTRSAVLTRFSLGHIRIGTFQRLAYFKQIENIKKLVSYCLFFYYPSEFKDQDENLLAARFFELVVKANAELVSQVMMAGFVHGVLNTDNINISGELFDYGPYRFLPHYDPYFTAAYFDHQGLYCYGRQPASFLWALQQLAESLQLAYPELPAAQILENFSPHFNDSVHQNFLGKLNLKSNGRLHDEKLLSLFFSFLEKNKFPFEQTFFDFNSKKILTNLNIQKKYDIDSALRDELMKILEAYEINDTNVLSSETFQQADKACTLLIDEIEKIWSAISLHDDWSLFENKLQSIRTLRSKTDF